jgi:hypothetical protein
MQRMSPRRRMLLIFLAGVAFGVFAAWAKGQDTDGIGLISQIRNDVGNLSSPWLMLAFIAGSRSRRLAAGALLGLLATMSALLGFYVISTLVVNLGGHGFFGDFGLELWGNRIYLAGGVATGVLFGALGAAWSERLSTRGVLVAGALLVAEPITLALFGVTFPNTVVGRNEISTAVYGAELALGVVVLLLARANSRPLARWKL